MKLFKNVCTIGNNSSNGCLTYYSEGKDGYLSRFQITNGCCQDIINLIKRENNTWWRIYVDKKIADTTLKVCNVTLQEYLEEISILGFPPIAEIEEHDSYYIFHIDNTEVTKLTYYVFCWIRHLYYYQNVVVNYFHYKKEWEINDVATKRNLLGFIAVNCGGYSVFYRKPTFIFTDNIIDVLARFDKTNDSSDLKTYFWNKFKNYTSHTVPLIHYWFDSFEEIDEYLQKVLKTIPKLVKAPKTAWRGLITINGENYIRNENGKRFIDPISSYCDDKGIYIYLNKVFQPEIPAPTILIKVLSRHPSHEVFRKNPNLIFNVPVLIRLGSITDVDESKYKVKINSTASIQRSSNKLLMKQCFDAAKVPTAEWFTWVEENTFLYNGREVSVEKMLELSPDGIVMKHVGGSRGSGNRLIKTIAEWNSYKTSRKSRKEMYIGEFYKNTSKEYRIHVSTEGVFLAWRKLRRNDTPDNQKWFFNNINCNWIGEQNELFDKPKNWNDICKASIAAIKSVGLTIGCVDVRVQSNKKKNPAFFILETNSAPSSSSVMAERYTTEIIKLVEKQS